jgi:hypothetical protein
MYLQWFGAFLFRYSDSTTVSLFACVFYLFEGDDEKYFHIYLLGLASVFLTLYICSSLFGDSRFQPLPVVI